MNKSFIKWSVTRITLLLLLAALIVSGCAIMKGARLEWEKIADGNGAGEEFVDGFVNRAYAGHKPRLIVITTPDAVSTLEGKVSSAHLDRIADTDYSSFWVAVIHRGTETTTDYAPIEISDVSLRGDTVTIYAQLHKEVLNDEYYTFIPRISPYQILRIEKLAGVEEDNPSFILKTDTQVISQICDLKGEHLPWEKMVHGEWGTKSGHWATSPQLVVVSDKDAAATIQDQLPSRHSELVAGIDFSTHFVVIVYQGKKSATGFSVEVIDVKQQDDTIYVCAQLHKPHRNQALGAAITSPYCVLQVEKTEGLEGEFTFVLMDNGTEIGRQVEIIP